MSESRRNLLYWLGLVLAFSPVLQNLIAGIRHDPNQRYTLLAPLLIGLLLRHDPASRCTRRVGAGVALVVLGLFAQSIGIAGSSWSIARVGLPVGMLGVALLTSRPALAVVVLAFGVVPLPDSVGHLASPGVESMLGRAAGEVLSWFGIAIHTGGPLLSYNGERLELEAFDSGIVTSSLFFAVGWYRAVRLGRRIPSVAVHAVIWGLVAVAMQPVAVILCVAALPLGAPDLGRFVLTHGAWLGLALFVLVSARKQRAGPAPNAPADLEAAA